MTDEQLEYWSGLKKVRLSLLTAWCILALIKGIMFFGLTPWGVTLGIPYAFLDSTANAVFNVALNPERRFEALVRSPATNFRRRVVDMAFIGLLFAGLCVGVWERRVRRKYGIDRDTAIPTRDP